MVEVRLRNSTFQRAGMHAPTLINQLERADTIGPCGLHGRRWGRGTTWIMRLDSPQDATVVLDLVEATLQAVRHGPGGSLGVGKALSDVWLQQRRLEVGHGSQQAHSD